MFAVRCGMLREVLYIKTFHTSDLASVILGFTGSNAARSKALCLHWAASYTCFICVNNRSDSCWLRS
jgi:hypothetical protein